MSDEAHEQRPHLLGTRVAIVSGHFSPEIGYQEVDLARAFTRLGAEVRVVSTTRRSRNARAAVHRDYRAGLERTEGFDVVRLAPKLSIGPNIFGCDTRPPVEDFCPSVVVLVGPGKLFGLELFSSRSPEWKRVAIIQDNSHDGRASGPLAKRLLRGMVNRFVKRPAYRAVVRHADRLVLNVPETRTIVSAWLSPDDRAILSTKALELRLGFDPERFYFDPDARTRWRKLHAIGHDELLLATATRAAPEKHVEDIIETVARLREDGLSVRFVLAGLLDDDYGRHLRAHGAVRRDPDGFRLLPILPQAQLRELFSACDLGFWPRAAITIQQAMGTGLPIVLHDSADVNHLLRDGENGWYVPEDVNVKDVLGRAIQALHQLDPDERSNHRYETSISNLEWLSYDRLALEIVRGLAGPSGEIGS